MGHKNQKCVICEQEFTGGNNPEPIKTMEQGSCCSECNNLVVIPFRLYLIQLDKSIQDNKERKLNQLISNKKYLCKDADAIK
jgi:hypothetical protein|tara:strand:- start:813 stop:1058 length:246 start_codon:yes stop_codon:yes gene_type:complete